MGALVGLRVSREVYAAYRRLNYYAAGVVRELTPRSLFRFSPDGLYRDLRSTGALKDVVARVNYCNRLMPGAAVAPGTRIDDIDRSKSRYFIDLSEHLRFFPAELRADSLFGDVTHVPASPTLLKSRPVGGQNSNSVLLNLDKLRHFRLFADRFTLDRKKGMAVWRGSMNNPMRQALVTRFTDHPLCDVGHTSREFTLVAPKAFLSPAEQFSYRYIISVEGCDVATNLKWIMASNSVCIMPRPRYETWFMEGSLIAGHHYVEVRDDFADLADKIAALEAEPERASAIVANANRHVDMFRNRKTEKVVSLLVLQKYFEATGQLPPSVFAEAFFDRPRAETRLLETA